MIVLRLYYVYTALVIAVEILQLGLGFKMFMQENGSQSMGWYKIRRIFYGVSMKP